jgi:phosphoribosylformylglycinamidine cyclo-ligase
VARTDHIKQKAAAHLQTNRPKHPADDSGLSYLDAGVDIDAGNKLVDLIKPAVKSTSRMGVGSGIGGFGALYDLRKEGWKDPLLVSGTDGVGTKLMLAREMGCHDTIGIDLVAMCVNDILTSGAEPLFFLDYFASGKLELEQALAVVEGIAEGCRQASCALIGGETAEMPGMYGDGEYDLAGFAVGAVERKDLLDGSRIRPGHRLLGLASSGPHSNGYSLVRKVVELSGHSLQEPYCEPGSDERSLGEALLEPTRIYVRSLLPLLRDELVDGLAHVTGGGLSENVIRMLDQSLGIRIDPRSWPRPSVFEWLQRQGGIAESEMRRTFNCGIGMVAAVRPENVATVMDRVMSSGIRCYDIGEVLEPGPDERVVFD